MFQVHCEFYLLALDDFDHFFSKFFGQNRRMQMDKGHRTLKTFDFADLL